ncbi:MAG: RdgB/HAM1 family non-canonical purine NTP pyrophosphatase [Candidatus Izemoplasmatales bacterium]|jgi:XTP/dITP diphosphohydrolase|nr:RdgB/HAM1 family non-canonical purine NTP pyrophosphatase [Candidatus Izemoplasmatales bacterium]
MKKEIIIASKNSGKIKEYQNALKNYKIISIIDLGIDLDIEETALTFAENAKLKAKALYDIYHRPAIADDSGLVVNALKNELGVKSKRFSKSESDDDNNALLLEKLKSAEDRSAYFISSICLYLSPHDIRIYEGKTSGKIIEEKRGSNGFGYDPLFLVDGLDKTYAELSLDEKHLVSHRGKAIEKLKKDLLDENTDF